MKRFSAREFLWLCAPVALVGAGFVIVQLLHPPRDADAVITLDVTSVPNPKQLYVNSSIPGFSFGWEANAQGGPQDDIQLLYSQKLVALGHGRSQVVYQEPRLATAPNVNGFSASSSDDYGSAQRGTQQNMGMLYENLPIWTQQLEWRGDFVALPQKPGANAASGVGNPATFPTLARLKGAARATENFPVAFDATKAAPLQALKLEKVSPMIASYGADTGVTTRLRTSQNRVFARLIAFDGKTERQLWSNLNKNDDHYWITGQTETSPYTWSTSDFLKLRDVPAQWGELTYIVDAAFNPASASANYDSKPVTAAEIERLKRAGWLVFSRRLTLRKAGTKIVAPAYSKTPNTKYLGAQTSVSPAGWSIKVRLRYSGPQFKPGEKLDLPYGPEFTEADGKSAFLNVGTSQEISKGTKPGEYLATFIVPLQSLGKPRPVTMRLQVADTHAYPLDFQTKLQVPKAPAP